MSLYVVEAALCSHAVLLHHLDISVAPEGERPVKEFIFNSYQLEVPLCVRVQKIQSEVFLFSCYMMQRWKLDHVELI